MRASNLPNHLNVTAVGGVLGSPLFGVPYAADNGRRVEAVAIRDAGRGKAQLARALRDRLGLDRAFQHRVAGEDPKGDETRMRHTRT